MLVYLQMLDTEEGKDKFTRLYQRWRRLMFYVAYRLLGSAEDAEDAVHEAFLAILKNFSKIAEVDSPKTRAYVVIIVERKAIDLLRKRKGAASVPLEEVEYGLLTREDPGLTLSPLAERIAALPAAQRQALTLRLVCGCSAEETAELMGVTASVVYKLVQRAKKRLEKELREEEVL